MKKLLLLVLLASSTIGAQCWQNINAGGGTVHGVKSDGTFWGWGLNDVGEIGDGTTTDKTTTTQVGTAAAWQSSDLLGFHTLALQTNGSLWASGKNNNGQLGNGTLINEASFINVSNGTSWIVASAGVYHSAAIRSDGTLWTWGQNNKGQLGDGTLVNKSTPTQVGVGNDWRSVSAGWEFTLAIKTDGTLWAWGANQHGQFGNGTTVNSTVPVQVGSQFDWAAIDAGWGFNVALKAEGTIWIWAGYTGEFSVDHTPQQIGTDTDWKSISGGDDHYAAVKLNGTLWASGENTYGQLGNGTTVDAPNLIQIGTATDWKEVFADGYQYTVGLKNSGDLYAWGQNLQGQLANGTNDTHTSPIPVACPVSLATTTFNEAVAVTMYPNPAKDYLQITGTNEASVLEIYALSGAKLFTQSFNGDTKVNLSLASGMYLAKITSGSNEIVQKLIVK